MRVILNNGRCQLYNFTFQHLRISNVQVVIPFFTHIDYRRKLIKFCILLGLKEFSRWCSILYPKKIAFKCLNFMKMYVAI